MKKIADFKCKYCNANMLLDDVDFNFKGNQDNYWQCENDNCLASCFEKIRYGNSIVTTVLMAIFGELLEIDWQDKVKKLTLNLIEKE